MPGLTGLASPQASSPVDDLASMLDALIPTAWLGRSSIASAGFACQTVGRGTHFGVAQRRTHDASLAFEGWFDDSEASGDDLAADLLGRYLEEGECFVESLEGSFQIVVHHVGRTLLYADALATRRLFYALNHQGQWLFSTEMRALMTRLGRSAPDPANLAHFLISGRFFAGQTALGAVRLLLPGEYVVFENGTLRREKYFDYRVESQEESDSVAARGDLEALIDQAILSAWQRSESPAFLLSGGYDSRYIFYTVLERAGVQPSELRTVIWGDRLELPQSDTWISTRIGEDLGTQHIALRWGAERVAEHFDDLFNAQSGMTDVCLTHVDEWRHCGWLRRERGIVSLFRGDEIFGAKGQEVRTLADVMARLALAWASEVDGATAWFGGDPAPLAAHDEHLRSLIDAAPRNLPDLRDTLYATERLPALQNQLTSHRAHEIETVNPLLDSKILRFYRTLPSEMRTGKRLFIQSFEKRFASHLRIPIATADNSVDWSFQAANLASLRDFLSTEIAQLPSPLDRQVFANLHRQLIARGGRLPSGVSRKPGQIQLPIVRLLLRAVVLGRWLRLWAV